jgi:hypothetical protein
MLPSSKQNQLYISSHRKNNNINACRHHYGLQWFVTAECFNLQGKVENSIQKKFKHCGNSVAYKYSSLVILYYNYSYKEMPLMVNYKKNIKGITFEEWFQGQTWRVPRGIETGIHLST